MQVRILPRGEASQAGRRVTRHPDDPMDAAWSTAAYWASGYGLATKSAFMGEGVFLAWVYGEFRVGGLLLGRRIRGPMVVESTF